MEENVVKPLSDIPAINRFLSYCRIRTVPSKTVVIHAGDLPDVLYYIISGSVEVMIEDEEGNEMVLAYLNRGQFFGEMQTGLPDVAMSALRDPELVKASREEAAEVLRDDPHFKKNPLLAKRFQTFRAGLHAE